MTALKNSIVEAAANGVDADPSHIEQLIEAMLSNDGAPAPSESHVLWLRRETTKLIRREINLLSRERIFQQRVDALGVPQDRFGLPLTHNKGAGWAGAARVRRSGANGRWVRWWRDCGDWLTAAFGVVIPLPCPPYLNGGPSSGGESPVPAMACDARC